MNPTNVLPSYLFKIHFNIILPSLPRSFEPPVSFSFPLHNRVFFSLFPSYTLFLSPFPPVWFGARNFVWRDSSLRNVFHSVIPSFHWGPNRSDVMKISVVCHITIQSSGITFGETPFSMLDSINTYRRTELFSRAPRKRHSWTQCRGRRGMLQSVIEFCLWN